MTVRELMIKRLVDLGLWPDQAEGVIEAARVHKMFSGLGLRWSTPVDEYPASLATVVWISVRAVAREWLAEHAPGHWVRPMFEDDGP